MSTTEDTIRRFVKRESEIVPFAHRFSLDLVSVEGLQKGLTVWAVEPTWKQDEVIANIAPAILDYGREVARSMSGMVRFLIQSFHPGKPKENEEGKKVPTYKCRSSMFFNLPGKAKEGVQVGENGIVTGEIEQPTPTGVLSQLMHEKREIMKINVELVDQLRTTISENGEYYRREHDSMRAQLMGYRRIEEDMRQEKEALFSRKHQREMDQKRFEGDEARKKMLMEMVMPQLTALILPKIAPLLDQLLAAKNGLPAGGGGGGPTVVDSPSPAPDGTPPIVTPPPAAKTPGDDEKFSQMRAIFLGVDEETRDEIMMKLLTKDPARAKKLLDLLTS